MIASLNSCLTASYRPNWLELGPHVKMYSPSLATERRVLGPDRATDFVDADGRRLHTVFNKLRRHHPGGNFMHDGF